MEVPEVATAYGMFQQPWWLEATAPGSWGEVVVKNGDSITARMPYSIRKKWGLTVVGMPQLTQYLGPWFRPSTAKYANALSDQKDLMESLIKQLPKFDLFRQNFASEVISWLPFYWGGFRQTSRVTYCIDGLKDIDGVWNDMRDNIRREIRKAEKILVVRDDLGIEKFLQINRLSFQRQGTEVPYTDAYVRRLDEACARRNQRKMFFAQDASGQVHAAVYIVYDGKQANYLMGGSDPALRTSGAHSLAMWAAVKFSASVTEAFDFNGSQIEPVERFVRAFGGKQRWFHSVTKASRGLRVAMGFKDSLAAAMGRD